MHRDVVKQSVLPLSAFFKMLNFLFQCCVFKKKCTEHASPPVIKSQKRILLLRLTISPGLIKSSLIQSLIRALFPQGSSEHVLINYLKSYPTALFYYHLIITEHNNHPYITTDDQETFN